MAMVSSAELRKSEPRNQLDPCALIPSSAPTTSGMAPSLSTNSANTLNNPPNAPKKRSAQQIMRAHYRQQMLPPRTWQQAEAQRQKFEELSAERNQNSRATYLAAASLADSHARQKSVPTHSSTHPKTNTVNLRTSSSNRVGVHPVSKPNASLGHPIETKSGTDYKDNPKTSKELKLRTNPSTNPPRLATAANLRTNKNNTSHTNLADSEVDPLTPQKRPAMRPRLEHRHSSSSSIGTSAAIAAAKHSRRSSEVSLDSRRSSVSSIEQLPSPQRASLGAEYSFRTRARSRSRSGSVSTLSDSSRTLNSANSQTSRVNASAAARASALNPIEVSPRVPMSAKFVSTLSQALRREQEQRSANQPATSQKEEATKQQKHELRLLKTLRSKPVVNLANTNTNASTGTNVSPQISSTRTNSSANSNPASVPNAPSVQDARTIPKLTIHDAQDTSLSPRMLRTNPKSADRSSVYSTNTVISLPSRRSVDSVRSVNSVDSASSDRRSKPATSSASSTNSAQEKASLNARHAAVHAGTRMEANMASIHMQVNAAVQSAQSKRNRRSLMKHYMPAASWSAPSRAKRFRRPNPIMQTPNGSSTTLGNTPSGNGQPATTTKPAVTPLQLEEPAMDYFSPIHSAPANFEVNNQSPEKSARGLPSLMPVSTPTVNLTVPPANNLPASAPAPTSLNLSQPKARTGSSSSNSFHGSMFGGVPGPQPQSVSDTERTAFYSSGPVAPFWSDVFDSSAIYQPQNVPQTKPSMRLPHTLRTNSRPRPKNNSASSLPSGVPSGATNSLATPVPATPVPATPVPATPASLLPSSLPAGIPIASSAPQLGAAFSANSAYPGLGPGYNNLGLGLERDLPNPQAADGLCTPSSYNSTQTSVPMSPRVAGTPVNSVPPTRLPLTLRQSGQKRFNEDKPWKGHKSQSDLTDRERKRYESLWMANRGTYLAYFAVAEPYQAAWEEAVQVYFEEKARLHHHAKSTDASTSEPVSAPASGKASESSNETGVTTHPLNDTTSGSKVAWNSNPHLAAKSDEEKAQRERQVEQVERFSEMINNTPDQQRRVEAEELLDTLPELTSEPSTESVVSEVGSSVNTDDIESLPEPSDAHSIHSVTSATSVLTLDSDLEEDDAVAEVAKRAMDVHGFAVARLWRRSRLPEDTLEQIWDLVDLNKDGTLDRSGFVIGMWLCDQCLYGRKLPPKISPELWQSAGKLNLKIRVKPKKTKISRLRKLPNILGKSMGYTLHGGRTAVKKAVQKATK